MADIDGRITARFVGKDGSLGYQRGAIYDLYVHATQADVDRVDDKRVGL